MDNEQLKMRQDEVLLYLSRIMRDVSAKDEDRLKAAELLGKYYGLFDGIKVEEEL